MIGLAAAIAPVVVLGGAAMAADESAQPLTLERIFASPDLAGPQPQSMKLSPDGKLVTLLKPRPDEKNRFDLWALDTATGRERMLVDSKKVGSGADLTEAEKMQRERDRTLTGKIGIVAYDWAPDGKSILVPLDGDLYLATLDGKVTRLTNSPGGELNPVISPAGGYVSFVRDQNLFVQPLGGGAAKALTSDGADTVHWGEAEFVAQEEIHRRTGYWWSPNDRLIAVERFDEAPVGVVTRAAIGADGTRVYSQRYPAAGTPNAVVAMYVIDPTTGAKVKVDLGNDPDIYLARVEWMPDGKTLLIQRENREQTQLDMLAVDPTTGKSKVWFSEKAAAKSWINLTDNYRALDDGSLIWWSERDGFGHLYRFAKGKWTQLTKGPWVVTKLVGVDQARGRVYFVGNKDDFLERQLYAVDLARPNQITRLTESGWWNGGAVMDNAATRVIVTRSSPDQPPQTYLADTTGKRIAWINENAVKPGHPYYPYLGQKRQRTFGSFKASDGTTLYYEMITPKLEPGKRYPVFYWHYGGPGTGQSVTHEWGDPLNQYIADQGYIFFRIDNRGVNNRGKAFEDHLYRAMGGVEVEDQLAGAKWLKAQSYVDPDRIGTYGWSYGGYMTLKMLEADPGVYAAGIAGAPVTKWELYDTHYTERYLGNPKTDPKTYAVSNAMGDATKISDPLLLMHGMSDDNVVFDNSTAFVAKLQAANRPFEMMFYPGKTHAAVKNAHAWRTILDFFDRTVKNKR
ncbi:MAG: DPP IV N-terminal domain-containing protein [Sphingomonas sp.]